MEEGLDWTAQSSLSTKADVGTASVCSNVHCQKDKSLKGERKSTRRVTHAHLPPFGPSLPHSPYQPNVIPTSLFLFLF